MAAEIVPIISQESSKHHANESLCSLKSSMLTSLGYKKKLNTLEMCVWMTEIQALYEVLVIEMNASTISSALGNGVEEKTMFYKKDTEELLKKQ